MGYGIQGISCLGRRIHELAGTIFTTLPIELLINPTKSFRFMKMFAIVVVSRLSCFLCLILQLANTEEFIDGVMAGNLGEVLIRYHTDIIKFTLIRNCSIHNYSAYCFGFCNGFSRHYFVVYI